MAMAKTENGHGNRVKKFRVICVVRAVKFDFFQVQVKFAFRIRQSQADKPRYTDISCLQTCSCSRFTGLGTTHTNMRQQADRPSRSV